MIADKWMFLFLWHTPFILNGNLAHGIIQLWDMGDSSCLSARLSNNDLTCVHKYHHSPPTLGEVTQFQQKYKQNHCTER